jgi:peptidoglycan/xylan/chitin deacetylase (PgdA/CDA1 family)
MEQAAEKLFSFRWDIDHRACITDGLPRIIRVCDEFAVKNTFFVNMGRSTNLREWLSKGGLKGSRAKLQDMEAIHLIKKIGWPRFVLEAVLSRPVGRSLIGSLEKLVAAGHELGQHGGSDHVVWSRRFFELPEAVIAQDVRDAHEEVSRLFGRPAGFTSPGFKSDERITRIVEELGFLYDGDAIGGDPHRPRADGLSVNHWRIPVTLCGPRTVPLLEWHGARNTPANEVIDDLNRRLDGHDWVVLYGHPCYEGVNDDMLRSVFRAVTDRGFKFITHQQMAERLAVAAAVAA